MVRRIVKLQVSLPAGRLSEAGQRVRHLPPREDAARCIKGVDGTTLDGKVLRACFGTTKYCNAFLRYQQCSTRTVCTARHGQRQRLLHERRDARQVRSKHAQSFHDATKIGANGVKTKILPAPANGSTQGRLGVTANGLPAPRIPIPFGGIAAPPSCGKRRGLAGLGRRRRGSSRRARSRGFSLRAARVGRPARGARAVVVPPRAAAATSPPTGERRVPLLWHRRGRERLGRVRRPAREHG